MSPEPLIVAIDGPSGVGKSTVGKAVAVLLGLPFLETGAMYRALGWTLLRDGIDPADRNAVGACADELDLELQEDADASVEILLDGVPLDARVRSPEVSEMTSVVSSYPEVRRRLVELQRRFANRRGAVVEGRDIGSRVFPETPFKFFLTAPLEVRVGRRVRQLQEAGESELSEAAIASEVAQRDERDRSREESPLTVDDSYRVVDTSKGSVEEIATEIAARVRAETES